MKCDRGQIRYTHIEKGAIRRTTCCEFFGCFRRGMSAGSKSGGKYLFKTDQGLAKGRTGKIRHTFSLRHDEGISNTRFRTEGKECNCESVKMMVETSAEHTQIYLVMLGSACKGFQSKQPHMAKTSGSHDVPPVLETRNSWPRQHP